MTQLADEELIRKWQGAAGSAGGERYVEELFLRYERRVALWCIRISGDREAAADLAQEILMSAYRGLSTFRGDAKFSTWLYTIARNHCFNHLRSKAARPETQEEPLLPEIPDRNARDPQAAMEAAEAARLLRELAESCLDATELRVLTLHYGEEMPLDAITSLLGMENASGAKAFVVSARRKLQAAARRWTARWDIKGGNAHAARD